MNPTLKKLAWLTVGFTYLLMIWGNFVSSTGSGLACPDWPTCHGSFTPEINFGTFFEWGHRLLAAAAGILIFVTIFLFWKSARSQAALKGATRTILILLGLQILLGGTTVLLGLSVAVSTIHLIIANLVFSGMILLACVVSRTPEGIVIADSAKLKRLSVSALIGLLLQIALGGMVRHSHAGLACSAFPSCFEGSFFPSPALFEPILAFAHRWWGFLLLGVFVQIFIESKKNAPALKGFALLLMTLAFVQFGLGIFTVLSGLSVSIRAIHAAVGYGIWGILFWTTLRSGALRFLWHVKI